MTQPIFNFGTAAQPTATTNPPASTIGGLGGGSGFAAWTSPATQQPQQPAQPSLNFSSGIQSTVTSTATPNSSIFSFGGGLSTGGTAGGGPAFSFGGPPAATPSAPPSFGPAPPATASAPLNFGGGGITSLTSAPPQPQPQPSTQAPAPASSFSFGGGSASASLAPSLSLQSQVPGGGTTLTLATAAAAPQSTAAPTSAFSFATSTPTSAPPTTSAAAPPSASSLSATPTTGTPGAIPSGTAVPSANVNFRQLQEQINKWTIDIEEQERDFIEQATKVNYWDKVLMANGDKISKLNEVLEKVKVDHTRMEHSLDFVKNAQKDFEGCIESLEAALPQHVTPEPERARMYAMGENMDTELEQMSEDLKEIIRHINESNKLVDRTDPVSQILRILNEHTDSLQWLEDQSNALKAVLDGVSQMHQVFRRDHERSLKLMFKYN